MIKFGARGEPHRGLRVTEVRVWPVNNPEHPRMYAGVSVTLNESLAIHGIRVLMVDGRAMLAMPSRRLDEGGWRDRLFPVDQATRSWLERIIFAAYREAIEATANRVVEVSA